MHLTHRRIAYLKVNITIQFDQFLCPRQFIVLALPQVSEYLSIFVWISADTLCSSAALFEAEESRLLCIKFEVATFLHICSQRHPVCPPRLVLEDPLELIWAFSQD